MITHVFADGSEGYEYELGDVVTINDVIGTGNWFRRVIGKTGPITEIHKSKSRPRPWSVAEFYVKHSADWGPCHCFAWMVKPIQETRAKSKIVNELAR